MMKPLSQPDDRGDQSVKCVTTADSVLVAGGGGFIGGFLTKKLVEAGVRHVRVVDIKPKETWYQLVPEAENLQLDLRNSDAAQHAVAGTNRIFNMACDMGGMGFIENHRADCMVSVLINTHLLMAARNQDLKGYFYASSACVYNAEKQKQAAVVPLREDDAYPAMPEDGYGWEKLFSERMCRHFREDYQIPTQVARFHNVYGPHGTYDGGREKAPAAICRKVIEAKLSGHHEIEIWGDGEQTRSFMYIDDCLHGMDLITSSPVYDPLNLGSDQLVTINTLVDIAEDIAGIKLKRRYNLNAPKGVRGRNSDNTKIRELLGWAPCTPLRDGLETTYRWIHDQMTVPAKKRHPAYC